MEQPGISGEPYVEPTGALFRVTTDTGSITIETPVGAWSVAYSAWAPGLIRWGGFAAILGGVLWVFVVLSLEWQTLHWQYAFNASLPLRLDFFLDYNVNSHFLATPLVFFSLGLLGLYALQSGPGGWLGQVGFFVSIGGLFLAIMATIKPHFVLDELDWRPVSWWYDTTSSGLAIMSLGLILFGIAGIRINALPKWKILLLMVTAPAIYIVPILSRAVGFAADALLFDIGLFAGLLVLFGVSWVLLGYSLWRAGPEALARSRLMKGR